MDIYSKGNLVFMVIIEFFAMVGATTVIVMGFTTLSLAVVILCTLLGTVFGIFAEKVVNTRLEKKQEAEIEAQFNKYSEDENSGN